METGTIRMGPSDTPHPNGTIFSRIEMYINLIKAWVKTKTIPKICFGYSQTK